MNFKRKLENIIHRKQINEPECSICYYSYIFNNILEADVKEFEGYIELNAFNSG